MLLISNIHTRQWNHLESNNIHNGQFFCSDRFLVKRGHYFIKNKRQYEWLKTVVVYTRLWDHLKPPMITTGLLRQLLVSKDDFCIWNKGSMNDKQSIKSMYKTEKHVGTSFCSPYFQCGTKNLNEYVNENFLNTKHIQNENTDSWKD